MRVSRSRRAAPRAFSSSAIFRLRAGWERKSCSEALRKFSVSATVIKHRRASKSISIPHIPNLLI